MGKADVKKKKHGPDSFLNDLVDKFKPKIQDQDPDQENMLDKVVSSNSEVDSPMSDDNL